MSYRSVSFILFFFIFALLVPMVALAQSGPPSPCLSPVTKAWIFEKELKIPTFGLDINDPNGLQLIAWLFLAGLALAAVLALTMLAINGVRYIVATGNSGQQATAKQNIFNAILGLILALAAVLLLFTINPQLTKVFLPTLPTPAGYVDPGCEAPSWEDLCDPSINKYFTIENGQCVQKTGCQQSTCQPQPGDRIWCPQNGAQCVTGSQCPPNATYCALVGPKSSGECDNQCPLPSPTTTVFYCNSPGGACVESTPGTSCSNIPNEYFCATTKTGCESGCQPLPSNSQCTTLTGGTCKEFSVCSTTGGINLGKFDCNGSSTETCCKDCVPEGGSCTSAGVCCQSPSAQGCLGGQCVKISSSQIKTQCSDGVDNSDPEDKLIDLADPGCTDSQDNDETDTPPPACTNECSPSGTQSCVDSTGFRTCGNYDSDTCLEWSSKTACAAGDQCVGSSCLTPPPPGGSGLDQMNAFCLAYQGDVNRRFTVSAYATCAWMCFADPPPPSASAACIDSSIRTYWCGLCTATGRDCRVVGSHPDSPFGWTLECLDKTLPL